VVKSRGKLLKVQDKPVEIKQGNVESKGPSAQKRLATPSGPREEDLLDVSRSTNSEKSESIHHRWVRSAKTYKLGGKFRITMILCKDGTPVGNQF
jgi:hypothetical protein